MSATAAEADATRGAAKRVARNTAARASAEFVTKFASLALMAVLTRKAGAVGLGAFVFAIAWAEVTVAPVDMGFDRYFLRRIARDRAELDRCFFNIWTLKLIRAVPVLAASFGILWLVSASPTTRYASVLMTFAWLLDGLSFTILSAFNGVERGDLVGATLAVQRATSGVLGAALLLAGYRVVTVAGVYVFASAVALSLATFLLARNVKLPARTLPRGPRRELRRASLPYAGQELLATGITRLDTLLLAAFATQAVVGYYGAAYRLLEATLFISTALMGAFAAMYTYLTESTVPTIQAVFQRSIKLLLILLMPPAVALGVLPGHILHLLFGKGFEPAITPLRLLAPTTVLLGVVMLSGSLVTSRLDPRILLRFFALVLVVNLAVNLALIPWLGATGAATAMLATEGVFAALTLRVSVREVGPLSLPRTVGAPLIASAVMAATLTALHAHVLVALAAGVLVYVLALAVAERRLAPEDYAFLTGALRNRLRWPRRATAVVDAGGGPEARPR